MASITRPHSRAIVALCSMFLVACGTPRPQVDAMVPPAGPAPQPPADTVLQAGLESPYLLDSGDGTAALAVLITPPAATGARLPLALSLVIDTSYSMEGEKLEHARAAARSLIEALDPQDEVALTAFAGVAHVVSPRVAAGTDRAALLAGVAGLQLGSATNIAGGMGLGLEALKGSGNGVRRLLLISDGMANEGPADPEGILASLPHGEAVTLSAMGVGTDYDEKVLTALARHGEGGYYHLTDPVQLAGIVQAELNRARNVAGREAVVTLVPAAGVEIVEGPPGVDMERGADGAVRILVGDVYGGVTHTLTVRVKVPVQPGGAGGPLAQVKLAYQPLLGEALTRAVPVDYRLTPSADVVTQSAVPAYVVAADRTRVAHVLTDAAALIKEGDLLEAQALLRDERSRLEARRDRLQAAEKAEVQDLIELFKDPYVDADLGSSGPAGASAAAAPNAFPTQLEALRQGRAVDESALPGLTTAQLRILRNVAYARHGYPFKAADLRDFFVKTGWYRQDASFQPARLTAEDVRNVATLKTWEQRTHLVAASNRPAAKVVSSGDFDGLVDQVRQGQVPNPTALEGLSLSQLRILRNAAYARHGYVFRAADLRAYFGARAWYRPDAAFHPAELDGVDGATVRRLKALEQARVFGGGNEAVREFELRNRARAHQVVH